MRQLSTSNSSVTRVRPIFEWLGTHADRNLGRKLVELAEGLPGFRDPGDYISITFEQAVEASPRRLGWMIENASRLTPLDGAQWKAYDRRITRNPKKEFALKQLQAGTRKGIPKKLVLEGPSYADCLIECADAVIWIEGKRHDWLSPSTTWDILRDQLARNVEAAAQLASAKKKSDFCVIICHENKFKHPEELLIEGYRTGTWRGGWPHLDESERLNLGKRIGILAWKRIAGVWPELLRLKFLADLKLDSK